MGTEFFNKEEIKKFINKNRAILKQRNEINFRKDNDGFKEDTFDELSSTTLNNHILDFIERADFLKSIIEYEKNLDLDYLKNFFYLEQEKTKSTKNIEKNLLEYRFSATTSSILIFVGTFADNFGFSKFFYNHLISQQLVYSCEIALRNIDLFTFEVDYGTELSEILHFKNIGQAKKTIESILTDFLNGLKDPKNDIYALQNSIFKSEFSLLLQKMDFFPPRLSYSILQTYLADSVRQSTTLIDKHISKNDTEKLKKIISEKNILNNSLEKDSATVALISNLSNFS